MDNLSIKALADLKVDIATQERDLRYSKMSTAAQEEALLASKVKRKELLDSCDHKRENGSGAVSVEPLPYDGCVMFTCDLCDTSWSIK